MENGLALEDIIADELCRLDRVEIELEENAPEEMMEHELEQTPEWLVLQGQRDYCKSILETIRLLRQNYQGYIANFQKI